MNDTSAAIEERLRNMWMSRSGSERLIMGCAMFDDAKAMARAGLLARCSDRSPGELRRLLFMQLYADDFPIEKLQKILRTI